MKSTRKTYKGLRWIFTAFSVASLGTFFIVLGSFLSDRSFNYNTRKKSAIFSDSYPVNRRFQEELIRLRASGQLTPDEEKTILDAVKSANNIIEVPEGVLWCLLFQESRLDHMAGVDTDSGASGLGQFSYFGFYEINNHLTRFNDSNLKLFQGSLGGDVRPIAATKDDSTNPSSYYHIPTAVAASAAYLNNRYLQLANTLNKQNYKYDPDILWLYAAMAYNKGSRSVFSFWNDAHQKGGPKFVQALLTDKETFIRATQTPAYIKRALKKIWPEQEASKYAQELMIHIQNIRDCSMEEFSTAEGR